MKKWDVVISPWVVPVLMFLVGIQGVYGQEVFTSSTPGVETFSVPANVREITVEVWGAGGSGEDTNSGGGGGGAYSQGVVSVEPGAKLSYQVGAGAAAESNIPGGDSWLGDPSTVLAKGGSSASARSGASGGSAADGIGSIRFSGGDGASGVFGTRGGGGGSSAGPDGPGTDAVNGNGADSGVSAGSGGDGGSTVFFVFGEEGEDGSAPGGGGGGGGSFQPGGAGGDGQIKITYQPIPLCSAIYDSPDGINQNLTADKKLDLSVFDPRDAQAWPGDNVIPAGNHVYQSKSFNGNDIDVTVDGQARVLVDGDLTISGNGFSLNADGSAEDLLLIVDGNLTITKNNAELNAIIYVTGNIDFGNNTKVSGALAAEGFIDIGKGSSAVVYDESALLLVDFGGACIPEEPEFTLDHLRIVHPGIGLTCSPADITVTACADADCDTLFSDPVTVDFISPAANWSPDPVTFTETTDVLLQYTTPEAVLLNAQASSPPAANPTRCFSGGTESCEMTFLDAGFIIDVPDHTAAVTSGSTIASVRKDETGEQCVPGFSNVTRDVALWSTYSDPDSGTESVMVDTQPIAKVSPGTINTLDFNADGIAPFDLTYPDVGRVGLSARYEGSEENGDAGLVLIGETDFIARPDRFRLDVPGNPEATDANGGVFRTAGESFEITVSVLNANGDVTPNFGRESTPESVRLETSLVAPVGGESPSIAGDFGAFGVACDGTSADDGTACGEFNWPEVGIIALTPRLAGASGYLGFEDVVGTRLNNVGRFIPARFELTVAEAGVVDPFCTVSTTDFAYMGQSLNWQNGFEPIITVDALNTAGAVTQNYTSGDFLKLDALGLTRVAGTNDDTAVDAEGNPFPVTATLAGTTLSNLGAGQVQYIFSPADTLVFDKTTDSRVAPFTPDYSIELSGLEDSDGVTASPQTPIELSPSFSFQMRYGRLNIDNAYGPETTDLIVPFRAVYYAGAEFAPNEPDSCWGYDTSTDVSLDDSGLSGGSTSVIAASDTLTLGEPPAGSELILSAPGEGNTGDVGVHFAVPDWLQGDYDEDGTLENPSALATFGVYRGHDRVIYWRER